MTLALHRPLFTEKEGGRSVFAGSRNSKGKLVVGVRVVDDADDARLTTVEREAGDSDEVGYSVLGNCMNTICSGMCAAIWALAGEL